MLSLSRASSWFTSGRIKIALAFLPFVLMAGAAVLAHYVNWKGERNVEQHLAWLREQGYATCRAAYFKPAKNPADDVILHPAMLDERARSEDERLRKIDRDSHGHRLSGISARIKRPRGDLGEREDARLYFDPPRHADEAAAAREILDELAPERQRMVAIAEAFSRPEAAWPVEWTTGGQVIGIRRLCDFAQQIGSLHLAVGEPDAAEELVVTLVEMDQHLSGPRTTLVSYLIGSIALECAFKVVQEGVFRDLWTEPSLVRFEAHFARIDPQQGMLRALRGELSLQENYFYQIRTAAAARQLNLDSGWEADREAIMKRIRGLWWDVRPLGLTLNDAVRSSVDYVSEGLLKDGKPRSRFDLADVTSFSMRRDALPVGIGGSNGYLGGESSAEEGNYLMVLSMAARHSLRKEQALAMLRTGVALERHRLKYGVYPELLEALLPDFLQEAPGDPFDRKALRYLRQVNGSPLLWSIGPDGIDDGGQAHRNQQKGDRVWITRPREP